MATIKKRQFLKQYIRPGQYLNCSGLCYICDEESVTVEHHAIPRSYGGEKTSVLIHLCPNCHKNLHAVEAGYGNKPIDTKQIEESLADVFHYVEDLTKAKLCLTIILVARDLIKNDPNKTTVTSLRMNRKTRNQLKKLKSIYNVNQQQLLVIAVETLYNKHFTS